MTRTEKIDDAVGAAGQLISALQEKGPINPEQARVLVLAVARAAVPNFEEWEAHDSAIRIVAELENENQSRNSR
jgi:hypothetical protein